MMELQPASRDIWDKKYRLKDKDGNPIDHTIEDTYLRVASALSEMEEDKEYWFEQFLWALRNGAIPAGRILSNAGAGEYKPATSTINCTVSGTIGDSIEDILQKNFEAGLTLHGGCGIGYEFSTLRPRGSFVAGVGAQTSGPLPFADIYDKMCFTISSAGGRRGAQMMTFDVRHPDIEAFIKSKREDGRFRQFNLSTLITKGFMEAVKNDDDWKLIFPLHYKEKYLLGTSQVVWEESWPLTDDNYIYNEDGFVACKVYRTVKAKYLWDLIMKSTYEFSEPGFILIDEVNKMNTNYFCEDIRATNPCGEQPLPPYGACLLGSINLTHFVRNPFTDKAIFDYTTYRKVVRIFTRMLDNVVEINGLPLKEQRKEIERKRRHGMGYLGLGSTLNMLGIRYGSPASIGFTEEVTRLLAVEGFITGVSLAKEKGAAPIMEESFGSFTGKELWLDSEYMKRIWETFPELKEEALKYGCRFTHHSSIAPTGTISLSLANNASNGIEPSFAHQYKRNIIKEGKKTKEQVDVLSYEYLLYKEKFGEGVKFPSSFVDTDSITAKQHVDIQAAAQYWIDSSISKTINVPTDYPFDEFKEIYLYAYEKGLKGCTTFRYNPEVFQGVLVKDDDLENTTYTFVTEKGETIKAKGNEEVTYEGEQHIAANLYDALKEGTYGKY